MRREVELFSFKEFKVKHTDSTLAVGTDAVLLASWVSLQHTLRVLDVGTGCGLIPLAVAQRLITPFTVLGIDIDEPSVLEAKENFNSSKWSVSLDSKCVGFEKLETRDFDLIISNPPFFRNSLKNTAEHKVKARHQDQFSMDSFASFCNESLVEDGRVALVYPFSDLEYLQTVFIKNGFFVERLCEVKPKQSKPVNRVLITFSKLKPTSIQKEFLCIRKEDNTYTTEYKKLTTAYYLAH